MNPLKKYLHRQIGLLAMVALLMVPSTSWAKKKMGLGKANEASLAKLMGNFSFGMNRQEILKALAADIQKEYQEQIAATRDVYEQDKLRRQQRAEVSRIKKSFTEFRGTKTGWDVSIIDDQFGHNTDESMMVYWESDDQTGKDQRRFFFFHNGRLYKMLIALSDTMLQKEQRNFEYFSGLMTRRFGPAQVVVEKDQSGNKTPTALLWRTKKHLVSAVDKLTFYGNFVLIIAEPDTEKKLVEARAAIAKPAKKNAIVEAVLEKDTDLPSLDSNKAAVDAITRDR